MKRLRKFAKEGHLAKELKTPGARAAYEAILLGKKIATLRRTQKMTQKTLAQKVKSSQSAIARIENGKQNLSLGLVITLAHALGKKIDIRLL
ncbi:transcriptional regulator [Candidatus Peregrinibacteria bacterium CG11_big_fil_rev_8_21_14_0_20_46_8]|nr:MAG: transcriptional regulator [Candidatus Peregrinibacteria bacterium CG11_big_fil_rev_8_21_14_0_20_46_8]